MNVQLMVLVMSMLTVITLMEALNVNVNSGIWEMVQIVKVPRVAFLYASLFYCWCILLVIPPTITLSPNSSQINIGRLREFSLTCQSAGDFAGPVVWMNSDRNVSSIGLCFSACLMISSFTYSFFYRYSG